MRNSFLAVFGIIKYIRKMKNSCSTTNIHLVVEQDINVYKMNEMKCI